MSGYQAVYDLGGIGKEYAVDAATGLIENEFGDISCLVNFGGDVYQPQQPVNITYDAFAIPAAMAYNHLTSQLNRFMGELEGISSELIGALAREGRI